MKAFNPDKELKKMRHGNKDKIIFGIMILLLIISIGSTYALYQVRYSKRIIYTKVAPFSNHDINIMAVYVDGKPAEEFPKKNSGYKYDHIDCDKGSTAIFDIINWKVNLKASGKDKCDVYFVKEKEGTPNHPELYQGLIPIVYGNDGTVFVADGTKEWYNYDEKRWANAVLVGKSNYDKYVKNGEYLSNTEIPMDEILQMYVWIPRYKYQLFNVNNNSIDPLEIQITFENGPENLKEVTCKINEKGKEICSGAENGEWFTHPAFTFGNTELAGIWVGKFESSGNVDALTIKPNTNSLRNINLTTMFNASRYIEEKYANEFNLNREQVDTHMMKNQEWGAMTYLAYSKYGRCDGKGRCEEVVLNTYAYITGYDNTNSPWNTQNGGRASTTGNMYGIYDASGCAWEYVMGNMVDVNGNFYASGTTSDFYVDANTPNSTKPADRYYDKYEYDPNSAVTHERGHLGDATRETLSVFTSNVGAWYNDYAYFPYDIHSWFGRGGRTIDGNIAGLFAFTRDPGGAADLYSFRVVLTAEDK